MRYPKEEIEAILYNYPDDNKRKTFIQENLLHRWYQVNCRGTLEVATGVGKTRVAVLAIINEFRTNPNANVYIGVPTTTLRDTGWPEELKKWGAEHLIDKIKSVCHVSMHEVTDPQDVDLFILDEAHHITEKSALFFSSRKVFRILALSATLPTMKEDPIKRTILDKLCPIFFTISLEDGVALKLINDFELIVLKFKLDSKHLMIKTGTAERPNWTTEASHYKYLTAQIARRMRMAKSNKFAIFAIISQRLDLIINLPTKKQIAKEVLQQIITEDKRTLVFCGSIDQCEALCGPNTYHSGNDEHPKTGISKLDAFKQKQIHYLGCVKGLNEGENLPDIDQSFIVQLNSKKKDLVQRIGRNIRWKPGTTGKLIILVAQDTIDELWFKTATKDFDKKRIKTFIIEPADLSYVQSTQNAANSANS
jgi:superfamily II DNA or RNA helicase